MNTQEGSYVWQAMWSTWNTMPAVHPTQNKGLLHMIGGQRCLETPVPKAGEPVLQPLSTAAEDHHFLNAERIGYVHLFYRITEHWSWKAPLEFARAKSLCRAGQLSSLGPFSPADESHLLSALFLYFDPSFHFHTASFPCCQHKYQCSCLLNWMMNVPEFKLHFTICKQF